MIQTAVLSALFAICALSSADSEAFLWETSLSPKAQRAKYVLEGIDGIIEQARKDFDIPGLAVGIVIDGHPILAKGYGVRDTQKKLPVDENTLFAIGSCTKAFTTFAIGTLVEDGLLDWDRPVIDVLPEFRLWDQYATQNLTLRDLVTHRTGIPRHDFMWYNSNYSRKELLKRLRYLEPTCDIRERYNYGNLSYLAAGLVLEQATGKTWEEIVSSKILKPLEMKVTNFSIDAMKKYNNYALPHIEKNGKLKEISHRDFYNVGPSASMNSNVTEMNRWMNMLLAQGVYEHRPLISLAGLQEMFAAQVITSGYPENKDAHLNAYGLGWYINSYRGHYLASHDGGVDGFTSVVSIFPYDGIGIVILANKNLINLPRYLSLELIDRILELPSRDWLQEAFQQWQNIRLADTEDKQKEDLQRRKGTRPSHALEEYVGDYEHPGYGTIRIALADGKLSATLNGLTCILDHWHYDIFSISEDTEDLIVSRMGTKFTFRSGANGEISELYIPYEPKSPEIIFQRKPSELSANLPYLRQFIGLYEIYNFTVEVMIRDHKLIAVVPGQPIFELIPQTENEFNVKSMTNCVIRFMKGTSGSIEQAVLVLPYGAYKASKKKSD